MKKRIIEDLHGHIFEMGAYSIMDVIPPPNTFGVNENRVFDRDITSQTSFILINYGENKESFAYTFYENRVYVYGLLTIIGYNQKNDIRHVKEKSYRG